MSAEKRVVLFAFVVMCIIMSSSTIATAVAPGQKYHVNGYVKSISGVPILGASVALYMGSLYINTVTTQGDGYFSSSTYQLIEPRTWKAVVSKPSYQTATKTVTADPDGTTSMGTIYLTPSPPAQPVISQVHETGQGMDNGVEYSVSWAATSTQYELKFYWSEDAVIDEGDLYVTHTNGGVYYDESPLPMSWTDSEYWFKITARSRNAGGWSTTETYGPKVLVLKYYPTDDATIDKANPDMNFNNDDLVIRHVYMDPFFSYRQEAILKFTIPGATAVKSAVLRMWSRSVYDGGHGSIYAYSMSGQSWDEDGVTWNSLVEPWIENEADKDDTTNIGAWDEWDVTTIIPSSGEAEICLVVDPGLSVQGSEYYSKDYANTERWPHIVVQYLGAPETAPAGSGFQSDTFSHPEPNPCWTVTSTNSPTFDCTFGATNYHEYIEDGGCLLFNGDLPDTIEPTTFGYDVIQDSFNSENAFMYRFRVGWFGRDDYLTGVDYSKMCLGIQFETYNGENLAYIQQTNDGAESPCEIKAKVGQGTEIVTTHNNYEVYGAYFEFLRYLGNDGQWRMSLRWRLDESATTQRLDSELLVDDPVASDPAILLRISCYATTKGYARTWIDTWVDSVKEIPVNFLSLWRDNSINEFTDPIVNAGFDQSEPGTAYPLAWRAEDGGYPSAEISSEESYDGFSCHADTTTSTWAIKQEIVNSDSVDFNAVRGNAVGFRFWAGHSANEARIRAIVRFWTETNPGYKTAVTGGWEEIPSDNWVEVSVRTIDPLPSDVIGIEVIIYGVTVSQGDTFDAFVDGSCFYIIVDSVSPVEMSYSNWVDEGERGFISIALLIYNIERVSMPSGSTKYLISMMPVIMVEATPDFAIRSIELGWSVSGETQVNSASTLVFLDTDDIEKGLIVETNEENYFAQVNDFSFYNGLIGFLNNPLGKLLFSLAAAGIVTVAGATFPVSTIVTSIVTQLIYSALRPQICGIVDNDACVGESAYGVIAYPGTNDDNLVSWANQNLDITWTVEGDSLFTLPTFQFHVRATFAANTPSWPFGAVPTFAAYQSAVLCFYQNP